MAIGQKRKPYSTVKSRTKVEPDILPQRARMAANDIVLNSGELKKLIRTRLNELGIVLLYACEHVDISYPRIKEWLNSKNQDAPVVTHADVTSLCDLIGITVRLTLIVSKSVEIPDEVKFKERKKAYSSYSIYQKIVENERRQAEEEEFE